MACVYPPASQGVKGWRGRPHEWPLVCRDNPGEMGLLPGPLWLSPSLCPLQGCQVDAKYLPGHAPSVATPPPLKGETQLDSLSLSPPHNAVNQPFSE